VLGKEIKRCELGESLLGRLLREYKHQGEIMKTYHVTLTLNYRCHPDIVSLLQPIFYPNTPLRCHRSLPVGFPYNSCLLFTCSSVRPEEKVKLGTNYKEAEIICHSLLNQELFSKLTMTKTSIGIMARFRNQVCQHYYNNIMTVYLSTDYLKSVNLQLDAIRTYCIQEGVSNLDSVSYIPTYCMQGIRS
jgi:ATP-dependent exoDNAse (exonuclease V) beta subunit